MVQKIQFDRNLYVASLIESYLKKRPNAMDSFDGIHGWWIKLAKIDESANHITLALGILLEKGVIEEVEDGFYKYALKGNSCKAEC